ncbi:MAG: hypothetical protein E7653_05330 [Ruminococcaceae bacterium]|nr:hypothetical protein [Oscillospiraceae bacterium]
MKRLIALFLTLAMLVAILASCGKGDSGSKPDVPSDSNFTLSFIVDGQTYSTIEMIEGETPTLPDDPKKEGYTFEGWYWDKDVWSNPFTVSSLLDTPISSNMSVYARFKATEYSISYETDGGTHNNPLKYTADIGFAFADAQKACYNFLGWYTDAAFTTQITAIAAGTTGDMTLYAKFELATYSITYENTKGAVNTNPATYTINSDTITFAPLSKDGYTFSGWYVGNTPVSQISKGSTGNLTLTAKWDTVDYNIIYHNVEGATHNNPANYDAEDLPLVLTNASKNYYIFKGWYSDAGFNNIVTEIAVGTTDIVHLYAKWEPVEYTATFMDGTTVVDTVKFTVETQSITEPAVPTHVGYTGKWESYTLGHEDITINAIYTPINYNIVYHNVEGATHNNPANYDVEDLPLVLTNASKNYYSFKGWYSDAGFNNIVTEIAVGTTDIVHLYAKWEAVEYTATFMDGTTVVDTVKFTVETQSITEPAVPTHAGYTGKWESYTLGHEDITINAVYTFYGMPTVELVQSNRIIHEDTDLSTLFRAYDYFGKELSFDVMCSGEMIAGTTVVVTVTATDVADNTVVKQYAFGVLLSEKPFVELYVDGELWQILFVDNASNYTLPMPTVEDGFESVWTDKNGTVYSKTNGIGIIQLPESIQLYYGTYISGYIPIYTVQQLRSISTNAENVKYCLVTNLDLGGIEWTPIGTKDLPFKGVFDGNGYAISNFKITDSVAYAAGLFGYNEGTIKNLGVENFTIDVCPDHSYAGGLVGYNYGGTISNCYATGDVTSSSSGETSSRHTGGLVGWNYGGTISNCYATGDVSSSSSPKHISLSYTGGLVGFNDDDGIINNCYATGDVSSVSNDGDSYAGGLVGCNYGNINNCYATGEVISICVDSSSCRSRAGGLVGYNGSGRITNCYAMGDVSSSSSYDPSYAGGLVGYNGSGRITNCYATGDVTSSSSSSSSKAGGLVGGNGGTITNCYATGDVTSSSSNSSKYSYAGGLVGYNDDDGIINNCYATGDISSSSSYSDSYAGGLVGCNSGTITNCYAIGDATSSITNSNSGYSYAGGLVGDNDGGTISNCYATGDVSSSSSKYSYAGGLVGDNYKGTITNCYRYSGQSFTVTKSEKTTYEPTNTYGTTKSLTELQSVTFQTTTLTWSADDWSFAEGTHPTLKNVGTTN